MCTRVIGRCQLKLTTLGTQSGRAHFVHVGIEISSTAGAFDAKGDYTSSLAIDTFCIKNKCYAF